MIFLAYLLLIIFGFIIPIFLIIFTFFNILASYFGAPYVATSNRRIDEILAAIPLKKGQLFLELGFGDGRVLRQAVKQYQVKGVGVEINPLLTLWARWLSHLEGIKGIEFKTQNITEVNFAKFPTIFMFLTPQATKKFKQKFISECQKSTVIISHGFKVPGFENKLFKTIQKEPFPTYFYRI